MTDSHYINAKIYCLNASRYTCSLMGDEKRINYTCTHMYITYIIVSIKVKRYKETFRDVRPARWICFRFLFIPNRIYYTHDVMLWSQNVSFSHVTYYYNTLQRKRTAGGRKDYDRGTFANRNSRRFYGVYTWDTRSSMGFRVSTKI